MALPSFVEKWIDFAYLYAVVTCSYFNIYLPFIRRSVVAYVGTRQVHFDLKLSVQRKYVGFQSHFFVVYRVPNVMRYFNVNRSGSYDLNLYNPRRRLIL